jgi:hypothetical protein
MAAVLAAVGVVDLLQKIKLFTTTITFSKCKMGIQYAHSNWSLLVQQNPSILV